MEANTENNNFPVAFVRTTGVTTIFADTDTNGFEYNPSTNTLTVGELIAGGSGIDDLNADELKSGTIPDDVFPSVLPAVDGSQLTNLPGQEGNPAATAEKLETARLLWGQSFDGTADVSGIITGATSITGDNSTMIIQPADSNTAQNIIIRGNNDTDGTGGSVTIGNPGRGDINFFTSLENGYRFYQPGGSTFYGSIQFDTLTSNQNYDFPDKSGTVALLDDITAGVSSSANNVLVDEESNVDADRVILFADAGDGVRRLKSDDSDLKYNPNSNTLIAGRFSGSGAGLSSIPASQLDGTLPNEVFPEVLPAVDGSNLTGVAASEAKKLQTPRTISLSGNATGSVQFDGSQDVDIAVAVNTTNSFGITLSDEGTDSTTFLAFSNQATGSSIPLKTNSNLTFDSTDGTLSASFFDGDGSTSNWY